MKEYSKLSQLFEQHGRPTDYQVFLEHPDVYVLKTHLSKELTSLFLCLLSQQCEPDKTLLERLVRYKNEKRLRDLEAAIIELANLGFKINVQIIHTLCYHTGKDTSFLPSVKLLHLAKQAGLLNADTNVVSDEVLRFLTIKKISLYKKLIEKSALDRHVLQNTSFSSLPSASSKIDACVEFYAYAKCCECTAVLNTPNDKIDVLALWEVCDLVKILKNLHETHRLTADIFLLVCKVRYNPACLLLIAELLEKNGVSIDSFSRHILNQGKKFSSLDALYKLLVLIERCDLVPINEKLLKSLVILDKKLNSLLHSLNYLEQRAALTRPCFTWIVTYYKEQWRKESASSTEQVNKKSRIASSYGLFSSRKSEKIPTFEIGAVLFALSQANLLEDISDWISNGNNHWVPECFTVARANFIQRLCQLGELHQHSIHLARETHFDEACLTQLMTLAKLHAPFPATLPADHAVDYLECLAILAPFSGTLPPALQQFAFSQTMLLKKILLLLNDRNGLTLDVILAVMDVCQQRETPLQYVKEVVFCTLLHWPITEIEAMTASASSEKVFSALQLLEKAGIDVSPISKNKFVLPGLYRAPNPVQEVKIILALSAAHAFNQETWTLACSLDDKMKAFLPGMIQRLAQQNQCHLASLTLIISAKKSSVALEVFLLLTTEGLSVSRYWEALMQHAHPLLLCRGLVELKSRDLLIADYFSKIAEAKQPLLAVNALAHILSAGISLASCWGDIAEAENPDECAEMAIGSSTPEKMCEDLPLELRNAVRQNSQPKLARQYLRMLLPIPHITTTQLLQILQRENAGTIVQALLELNKLTLLNSFSAALVIYNPDMFNMLKNFYLSTSIRTPELLTELLQTHSVQEAENCLEREIFFIRYPHVAALLRESMADMSKHDHWIEAVTLLNSVNEVNETSIAYLQRSSEPNKRAEMMVALKKSGLYTMENIDRAIVRENQSSGVYRALHNLADKGDLNALLFNFVMINSEYAVVEAAQHIISVSNILPAHLDWLATYPGERFGNAAVSIINVLHYANLLNRSWVEKIIQQVEPSLEDIRNQLQHIPSALLDADILQKIFTTYGICYVSDEEEYYNPFQRFSENDDSLLTKEVIHVILTQPEGESYTVYRNMLSLKQAELFNPEIIPYCTTKERTQAIIALSQAQQWNETNKAIVLASRDPHADALLIACLVQQNKYNQTTANLLLLRLELMQSNPKASLYTGKIASYFSRVLKELLDKRSMLQESTVHCLLSTEIKWKSMHAVLELIKEDALTDDSVCLIAISDQAYLHAYLDYIYNAFDEKECHFADILKLCEYESYLNHPELLKVIEASVSYEARKKSLDTVQMQQLLSDLWCLCQAGDQAAITARILSPIARVATSSIGYRP